jgi:16S rRNA G1207 methylase RsmC
VKRKGARREPRLPAPSSAAFQALGPYARTRLVERALGQTLTLDVPGDVFSHQRIDEGTLLLLDHLPERAPRSVLDLGCGYGALGLPIAAKHPQARCVLVDRDLLAVAASAHNARALGLANVTAQPGLGYRDLPSTSRFDWVLCNVPARIGPRAIRYLLEGGRTLGEVRVVVIRDLAPVVEALGLEGVERIADGPRHVVFALERGEAHVELKDEEIYARDETRFEGLTLSRPHDVSEDPAHLPALALLAEALPRAAPRRVLCFRAGYGALPLCAAARWADTYIAAQERDLLESTFILRNASALKRVVEVREALFPADAFAGQTFDLVLGELSSPAGEGVAARELREAAELLAPRGQALILATEKMLREWFPKAAPKGTPVTILLRREGACVLRLSRPALA